MFQYLVIEDLGLNGYAPREYAMYGSLRLIDALNTVQPLVTVFYPGSGTGTANTPDPRRFAVRPDAASDQLL